MARTRLFLALVVAACATTRQPGYVPGGADLPQDARAAYGRALDAERGGDARGALEILHELCANHPLRLVFHLQQVRIARETLGPEAAAALYEPAPAGVDAERAGVLAAIARLEADDLAGRMSILDFAAQREPAEPLWQLAMAEVELQAYDSAVDRAGRENKLGRVQDSAESYAEATRTLERSRIAAARAFELDPGLAEAQVMLGYLRVREADQAKDIERRDELRRQAEDHYLASLEIDGDNLPALINLAENYLYFNQLDSAGRMLRRAAELTPADPLVWNNLGVRYHAVGQLGAAVECYRESLRLDAKNARTRTALSDCLRRRGKPEEAVQELERARGDAGEDKELLAEIAFKLGAIHEHEGRYGEAIEEYERHIALGGEDSGKARSRIRAIYESAFE